MEKLQLAVDQQHDSQRPSKANLVADELLDRAVEQGMTQNSLGDERTGRIADTILWAKGSDKAMYSD